MKPLFSTIALVLCLLRLAAQSGAANFKTDSLVLQRALLGEEVEFIVLMTAQADLAEARFLVSKAEKGNHVFQRLTETASRTQESALQVMSAFGAPHQSFHIVNAIWSKGKLPLLEALASLPEVAEIQGNPRISQAEPEPVHAGNPRTITWGIGYINADDVWALGFTGTGVVIGGQDTGYDWQHPALKLKYRGWNGATSTATHDYNWHDAIHEDNPGSPGSNPCGFNVNYPCDDGIHGTHTMGTMVGDDGAGNQVGVAPGAKWMGCRNMELGWGTPATYLECFQWFLAPTNLGGTSPDPAMAPHVINNSWACPPEEGCNSSNFATMEAAVENLRSAGVVVVVSAGNSGPGCATINAPPAIFPGSLTVGATNSSGGIAGFSSRGPTTYNSTSFLKPNISAPGVSVYSSVTGGGYGSLNGTSMAGPHVAGAVALVVSANPSLAGQVGLIETILETTATGTTTTNGCGGNTSTSIPNNTFGYGILNAQAAVNSALSLLPVSLLEFRAAPAGAAVQLDWEVDREGTLHHFEVEHADDRLQWQVLDRIPFAFLQQHYGAVHGQPVAGINYYRLKMVDIDGSIEFSKAVSVDLSRRAGLAAFPNPSPGFLSLAADWPPGQASIRVTDAGGTLVLEREAAPSEASGLVTVDLGGFPPGVYFLQVSFPFSSGAVFRERVVKY